MTEGAQILAGVVGTCGLVSIILSITNMFYPSDETCILAKGALILAASMTALLCVVLVLHG